MRAMEIPSFPRKIEILDLNELFKTRLSQTVVTWPEQAIPLLGYMCYPNDLAARDALRRTIRSWAEEPNAAPAAVPKRLGRIQSEWLRVADVFHLHFDLFEGQRQARRGGPSIGKAITLVGTNAKSWGTGHATLWKIWSAYKDVAHLVNAATLISAEARTRYRNKQLEPSGLRFDQFIPFQMAMLMPDLVFAVALEFQRIGLSVLPHARTEPTLDPETLWRIPADLNVAPLPPPTRTIRAQDLLVLKDRRAGNRGKGNAPNSLVFGRRQSSGPDIS